MQTSVFPESFYIHPGYPSEKICVKRETTGKSGNCENNKTKQNTNKTKQTKQKQRHTRTEKKTINPLGVCCINFLRK